MKSKFILAAAIAASFTASVQADVDINITGATAFRQAAIKAIIAAYGGTVNVGIVHSNSAATQASAEGASAATIRGAFPGVAGTTTIRCRWSGSTEGIRDLCGDGVTPNDVFYYPDSDIPAIGVITAKNENTNPVTANVPLKAKFSFSDVQQTSSPSRLPVLNPADSRVGVVTFTMLKNEGVQGTNLTSITSQQWRALLGQTQGTLFLDIFTGVAADATTRVFATGRNDGSGTRAEYLIEPGYGVSKLVKQWKLGVNGQNGVASAGFTGDVMNILQFWPTNDGENAANTTSIWNPTGATTTSAGNGGYTSGANVRDVMKLQTTAVTTVGPTGAATLAPNPKSLVLVTSLSTADALNAMGGGAIPIGYNGVTITPIAAAPGLSAADLFKVTDGQYTHWSYERLYHLGTLSADENTVYTLVKTDIPTNLASAGVALTSMNVTRQNDGDPVQ